jgi:hypothetical protein
LQIKAKKGKSDIRTSIVSFLLCLPYSDGAAHDNRLHLSTWLCDHDISRHAHGVPQSPSPQSLLAHLYASRLARAQNLGRDGQVAPATITAWRFGRLLKATYWNVHLIVSWLAQGLLAILPPPTNAVLYLFGDGSHANKRGAKNPGGTERAHQPASSVVFWPTLRIVDGSVGWLSRVSRLSHHLPKRHTAYRTENALFRGMVGEFTPPRWAKLVIVGGDSAYSSKDDMRMVQDRDKAALSRRWGFVFAIARTWKMVEKKTIKQLVTHVPRQYYQCTRVPSEHTGRGLQDLLDVSDLFMSASCWGSHCGAEQKRALNYTKILVTNLAELTPTQWYASTKSAGLWSG